MIPFYVTSYANQVNCKQYIYVSKDSPITNHKAFVFCQVARTSNSVALVGYRGNIHSSNVHQSTSSIEIKYPLLRLALEHDIYVGLTTV